MLFLNYFCELSHLFIEQLNSMSADMGNNARDQSLNSLGSKQAIPRFLSFSHFSFFPLTKCRLPYSTNIAAFMPLSLSSEKWIQVSSVIKLSFFEHN